LKLIKRTFKKLIFVKFPEELISNRILLNSESLVSSQKLKMKPQEINLKLGTTEYSVRSSSLNSLLTTDINPLGYQETDYLFSIA